ncbi:MAG: GTP-sensing pleiotropic transcriptional regulator CodY [Ignavibacteriales bacterium]
MSKTLLEKARAINKLLQQIPGHPVDFNQMAIMMADNLECNVYIVGRRGQLGGYAFREGGECADISKVMDFTERFPGTYNPGFMELQGTKDNIELPSNQCIFKETGVACKREKNIVTLVPVYGGARRLGTLILTKPTGTFSDEDIVLAEYGATVVANELMRVRSERIEEEARKKAAVQIAVATLSFSEREAAEHIMAELKGNEGLVVASRIADKVGITRSVIVSALRKFESAGVIESRSLGMKGTYIKVLNDNLFDELEKH